ncbi:AAA family ATPase (plasmid) [Leisingera sp. S132]|uniref:GumC family protein n=1 Tax=Leisingera sp. S132 TaxID=2867016 RepID=UPI0021A8D31E|nr:AAA family ATPase [Leisingera sp. S132]UWQ81895.1 AAA family ATPase [Leisingera sp. S132]
MNILNETSSPPGPARRPPARPNAGLRLSFAMFVSWLRRYLWLMLLLISACTGGAWLLLEYIPERYTARATIVLTQADFRVSAAQQVLETEDLSRYQIETELDYLRSNAFLEDVAERLGLQQDPAFNPYLAEGAAGTSAGDAASAETQRAAVTAALQAAITVARRGDSLAIDILTRSGSAQQAADIANAVAERYIAGSLENRRAEVRSSVEFLRRRIAALNEELAQSEIRIAAFIRENQLDDPDRTAEMQGELQRLAARIALAGQGGRTGGGELQARHEALQAALNRRTRAELTLLNLQRQFDAEVARYQTFAERRNTLEAQIDILTPGARQITRADVPSAPAFPNRPLILAAGLLGGVALAGGVAFLCELTDRRIWMGSHAENVTGLPNLAVVPRLEVRGLNRPGALIRHCREHPRDAYTESMRGLLTLLSGGRPAGSAPVVAVTSALADEGKSTLALSLALAAAQEGEKVLLIDFDVYKHGVTRMAGQKAAQQTPAGVLSKSSQVSRKALRDGVAPGVDLLNFKHNAAIPREMPAGAEAARSMAMLRSIYDLILLDTPPVLLTQDAIRVAGLADTVLLLAHWGRTTEEALENAAGLLSMNRVPASGSVLAGVDPARYQRYGYGTYYGGYYAGYGSG